MTTTIAKHPVELLRDGQGIYGIGAAKEFEADHRPRDLIIRPDRLSKFDEPRFIDQPILQMITGGFRHGMFCHTSEEHLRRAIHHGMLRRAGLPWPPPGEAPFDHDVRYWSSDPRQQVRNRQIYHGLRLGSLSIINKLIGQTLEEAAHQEAVRLARRFRFYSRFAIYRAAAQSPRALQITEAFPTLSLAIFEHSWSGATDRAHEAAQLVDAGAPLRHIAELMRVPMAFRKVKPAAAGWALSVIDALVDQRLLYAFMPESLPRMKLWLRCIGVAKPLGPAFVEWTAKRSREIEGSPGEVLSFLNDLTDWVEACHRASVPSHIFNAIRGRGVRTNSPRGEQFVVRRFSPDMSLKTVRKLSSDWHEAVANNMSGPCYEFPEPWCCGGESGGYDIVPIATSGDLYREGHALHHCVGTQGHQVQSGEAYFYSIRMQNERVATLKLVRHGSSVAIGELRGSCNSQVPKEVGRAARSWLQSQREFRFPKERIAAFDALGEIPF